MTAPAVGIDLGTTYSCVAVFRNGSVEVIPNQLGNRTMPSVVAFADRRRLVGEAAKDQDYQNPENTVYDAKRLIGRKFDDQNVQTDMKNWPFQVVNDDGRPKIRVNFGGESKTFHPEEISAMVLGALKTAAEAHLGGEVTQCVVTVPAHFGDAQRQATRDAAAIAGLRVLRVINEPTAGALAYGLGNEDENERNVLIYDFGGGTFDVSVLTIEEGIFEVRATRGDTHLGGEDLDARLLAHLADEFTRKHPGCDIRGDSKAIRRLRTACEKAKRQLSGATECSVQLDNLHAGRDFATTLTRACFEALNEDLFEATITCVRAAMSDCGLVQEQIARVVLVGGSSRIPRVQRLLRELFGGRELDHSVSPDEAVARGAAVQAAILDGDPSDMIQDLVLVDITPLSLGTSKSGGRTSIIIEKNTVIPTKKTKSYHTVCDNQTKVKVRIMEGERAMTKDNNELGYFTIKGIPAALAGKENIDYTFEIDADGILHVSAVVRSNKKRVNLTVTGERGRLRPDQIEKMKRDAEIFKEADKRESEIAGAKSKLEYYCRNMKSRAGRSTAIPRTVKEKIERKCGDTLEWLESHQSNNKENLEKKQHEMMWVCHQLE